MVCFDLSNLAQSQKAETDNNIINFGPNNPQNVPPKPKGILESIMAKLGKFISRGITRKHNED